MDDGVRITHEDLPPADDDPARSGVSSMQIQITGCGQPATHYHVQVLLPHGIGLVIPYPFTWEEAMAFTAEAKEEVIKIVAAQPGAEILGHDITYFNGASPDGPPPQDLQ